MNHDQVVDIEDVTMLISYVLCNPVEGFFVTEADITGEQPIDVVDVTTLISRVLGMN